MFDGPAVLFAVFCSKRLVEAEAAGVVEVFLITLLNRLDVCDAGGLVLGVVLKSAGCCGGGVLTVSTSWSFVGVAVLVAFW